MAFLVVKSDPLLNSTLNLIVMNSDEMNAMAEAENLAAAGNASDNIETAPVADNTVSDIVDT